MGAHLNHLCAIIDQLSIAFKLKYPLKETKVKLGQWKKYLSLDSNRKNSTVVPIKHKSSTVVLTKNTVNFVTSKNSNIAV